jgi:hypothetical protein
MLNELSAVSIASGAIARSASRVGIRGSDPSWHDAQCCL